MNAIDTKNDLETKLKSARVRFDTLVVQAQAADSEINKLESALAKLQNAADEELLAPGWPKEVAAAEKLLAEANTRRAALARVIARQKAAIEDIESELVALRRSVFLTEIEAPQKRLYALLEQFLTSAAEVSGIIQKHGEVANFHALFPAQDASGSFEIERSAAASLVRNAMLLAGCRERWGRDRGRTWKAA